jgi:enoyl-CoA hydratase/carnithine racemase
MSELVKISIEDHIADVRFNRPEKFNALSFDMIDAMAGAIDRLARESGVRVVVISGEGKSFCAGLDIENFAALQSGTNKFPI